MRVTGCLRALKIPVHFRAAVRGHNRPSRLAGVLWLPHCRIQEGMDEGVEGGAPAWTRLAQAQGGGRAGGVAFAAGCRLPAVSTLVALALAAAAYLHWHWAICRSAGGWHEITQTHYSLYTQTQRTSCAES